MVIFLLVLLLMTMFAVLPAWPHSRQWGYDPSGVLGFLAVILIIRLLAGGM